MAYEGNFMITFDVTDTESNLLDGKLVVRLQNDAAYAALTGEGLVVLDRFLPTYGRYPVKVDGGYVLTLPTDVPTGGDPADSLVGYELTFETDLGTTIHATFLARPEGSDTLLSVLADAFETVDPATSASNAAAAAASAAAAAASAATVAAGFGRVWTLDRATYGNGVADAITHIETMIDAASAAGGGDVLVDGTYRVSRPIRARSNVRVRGLPGSSIFSTSIAGGPSANIFYPGNYNPQVLHTNGGSLNHDSLAAVTAGDATVTLTSNTNTYTAGTLVIIWTTADPYPQLTKVLAVAGNVLTLQAPVSTDFSGVAHISPGGGHLTNLFGTWYDHYFVENFRIEGLHLAADRSSPMARAACLNGKFQYTCDAASLVYGNAYTGCTFDVSGTYSNRAVELTDGSRGNIIRVDGSYRDQGLLDAGDPLVVIGRDDTIAHLRLRDSAPRTGYLISFYAGGTSRRSKVLDGVIDYKASGLGAGINMTSDENMVEKVRLRSAGAFTGTAGLVRVADATNFTLRDITANVPTSGSGKGIRFFGTDSNGRLDRVRTPQGSLEFANASTTIDNVTMEGCDVLDVVTSGMIPHAGRVRGRGNRVRAQDELALVATDRLIDTVVAATTETAALTRTFAAAQAMYYRDRIILDGLVAKGGTAGTFRLKLTFGGLTIFDHTTATTTGFYAVEGFIEQVAQAGTIINYHVRITDSAGATVTLANRLTGLSLAAASTLTFAAWKNAGGDTMTIRRWGYQWRPFLEA